ncbi:MAG: B12-binding domain-containing radical SAM protein [Candidatus Binataceae bacterium]
MTKVTLVRPPGTKFKSYQQIIVAPPIGIAYLAGSLRAAGHQVSVIDALGEAPFRREPCFNGRWVATGLSIGEIVARIPLDTEMIGVSCMFSQDWPYTRKVIETIRRSFPRALIVAGGEHITALPLFILDTCPEIDVCVLGEGEETIVEVANCVASGADLSAGLNQLKGTAVRRGGKAVVNPERARLKDVEAIPRPAWDLIPIGTYLDHSLGCGVSRGRPMPILATRGCPYQCSFCSSPSMWTTRWGAREPAKVLDEIQEYIERYKATDLEFYDLTALMKKEWILTFARLIEERGLKFTWQLPQGTRSEALDAEVCQALYRTGCRNLTYAPESGSPEALKRIKKRVSLDKMLASMRAARREGIFPKANIIIGFPDETRREVWQTVAFLARMGWAGVYDVWVYIFSPYPGSELFKQLRERGKLPELNEEYFLSLASFVDLGVTISRCENLSSRELSRLRIAGYMAFYGMQYARRPGRLLRTLYNAARNRQESRMDKTVHDFFQRIRGIGRQGTETGIAEASQQATG